MKLCIGIAFWLIFAIASPYVMRHYSWSCRQTSVTRESCHLPRITYNWQSVTIPYPLEVSCLLGNYHQSFLGFEEMSVNGLLTGWPLMVIRHTPLTACSPPIFIIPGRQGPKHLWRPYLYTVVICTTPRPCCCFAAAQGAAATTTCL